MYMLHENPLESLCLHTGHSRNLKMLPDPLINKLLMVKYVFTVTTQKLYQFEVLHGVNMKNYKSV